MRSKKQTVLLLFLFLLTSLVLSACGDSEEAAEEEESYNTSVEVVELTTEDLASYFELSGELDSSNQTAISSKVNGLVTSVNVEVGQKVKAGKVLFTLDTSDLQNQIEETTKALEASKASIETIKVNLENQKLTVKNQNLTVDNQKLNVKNQQLNLDNRKLDLENQELNLNNQKLTLDNQKLGLQNESDNIAISQQSLDDAQLNYDRIKQLYDAGAAAQSELDKAQSSLNQAQLTYNKANTNYEQSKLNVQKVQVAYDQAAVAYKQTSVAYDQAQLAYNQASVAYDQAVVACKQAETVCKQYENQIKQTNLQIEQSELALAHLRESLKDYTVVAPVSGEISSFNVHKGERIAAQNPVITLVSTDTIVAKINVAESSIDKVKEGLKIKVNIPALDKSFTGVVTSISPTLDAAAKAYPVKIALNNSGGKMKSGMVAKIQLASDTSPGARTLPKDAVLEKDGAYYVYIVDDQNIARQQNVEVGLSSNTAVEIISGLDGSEQVICSGNQLVSDGQQVNIVSSSQKGE